VSSARSSRSPSSTYSPLIASGSPPGRTRSTCSRCSVSARSSKAEMSGLGSGLVKTAHPAPASGAREASELCGAFEVGRSFCAYVIVEAVRGSTRHRYPPEHVWSDSFFTLWIVASLDNLSETTPPLGKEAGRVIHHV